MTDITIALFCKHYGVQTSEITSQHCDTQTIIIANITVHIMKNELFTYTKLLCLQVGVISYDVPFWSLLCTDWSCHCREALMASTNSGSLPCSWEPS